MLQVSLYVICRVLVSARISAKSVDQLSHSKTQSEEFSVMQIHEYSFKSALGHALPLGRWQGQPILMVNTASECGYTPQYRKLQNLWEEYRRSGLIVLGIPCNDFGGQEPGSNEEIAEFCSSQYQVTFPVTTRQSIIGENPHPLFIALREEFGADILPRWNFHKYLFSRDGELVEHFPSKMEPDDPGFRHEIESNLGAWTL
jgi:glutathione peroxidase